MGLFWSSKELSSRAHNYDARPANLVNPRRGNLFIEEKGMLEGNAALTNKESIGGNWEFEVQWLFIGSAVARQEDLLSSCWR